MNIRAFTLLETLVAVSVLLMALLGPFTIASQSLRSAFYARDQVTAFYLAQEGIEYVRAVRDQNYLSGNDWMESLAVCTGVPCTVDMKNFEHALCPENNCAPLTTDINSIFSQQTGAGYTPSKFTRVVSLTEIAGNPDQKIVSVTVSWQSVGITRSFTIRERIFDWL